MNTEKIHRYIWLGRNDLNWYEDCERLIEGLYGKQNKRLVALLLAATSINSSMKSNVTLFKKVYAAAKNRKPIPRMLPNIMEQVKNAILYGQLSGRKINSFANAMSGDSQAVVVDIWLLRAFDEDRQYKRHTGPHRGKIRSSGATKRQYDEIEEWVRTEALHMGIQPRQLSAMIWSGTRTAFNGPDLTHYRQVLAEASMLINYEEYFKPNLENFKITEISFTNDGVAIGGRYSPRVPIHNITLDLGFTANDLDNAAKHLADTIKNVIT